MIWLGRVLDHRGTKEVPAPSHSPEQLLTALIQCATELEGTLQQRIISNEGVGPHCLHQFLLADQPSRVFHQLLQGFIKAKLISSPALSTHPLAMFSVNSPN